MDSLTIFLVQEVEKFNKLLSAASSSLKPLKSWIVDLQQRIIFINNWLCNGKPKSYWISAFFFQQGFITGIIQNHSRKYKIPIDTLSFEFTVLNNKYNPEKDIEEAPSDGVYVYGLYLDGAKWNDVNGSLKDSNIGELYCKMPIIHFIPCQNHQLDEVKYYECPLYKTSVRAGVLSTTGQSTNYILPIELQTTKDKKSKYWIKRGVALLTQLND